MARRLDWQKNGKDVLARRRGIDYSSDVNIPTKPEKNARKRSLTPEEREREAQMNAAWAAAARAAKERKRLENVQRMRAAQAAKAKRRLAHQQRMRELEAKKAAKAEKRATQKALEAAAKQQRRKKREEQLALEAKRRADPVYQAQQAEKATEVAARLAKRMKSVVVVRKRSRQFSLLNNNTSSGKPSPSR